MRKDDAAFFDHLATQARDLAHPQQVREFWKVIRRSLPKMRSRKQHIPPMQLEHLEEQWHPYFQALEVGSSVTPQQLVKECFSHQMNRPVTTDQIMPFLISRLVLRLLLRSGTLSRIGPRALIRYRQAYFIVSLFSWPQCAGISFSRSLRGNMSLSKEKEAYWL